MIEFDAEEQARLCDHWHGAWMSVNTSPDGIAWFISKDRDGWLVASEMGLDMAAMYQTDGTA